MEASMSLTSPAVDQTLKMTADADLVRQSLCRICEAHHEISLAELVSHDDEDAPQPDDRRGMVRAHLQLPVVLTPVDWCLDDDQAVTICGPEQVGVTRDVSPTGIGLTHDHPLSCDAAIVQFDLPHEGPLNLVVDLRWSVPRSRYSYMSGGRVIGLLENLT
jgi:hypothetical protein